MDFVLYRAKGKNGFLYDMSLDPGVDFSILKKTRKIDRFEIISERCSLEECRNALNKIYNKSSLISSLILSREYLINSALKKSNIKRVSKKINIEVDIPDSIKISKVESCITGRVVSLDKILSFEGKFSMTYAEIIKSVQALYCMRRIKIIPAVKKERNKIICSFCEKEPCPECCYGFKDDDVLLYAANNYTLSSPHNVTAKKTKLSEILKNVDISINEFLVSKKNYAAVWGASNAFDFRVITSGIAEYLKTGKNILYVTADSFIYEAKQKFIENMEGAEIDITDGYSPDYWKLDIAVCSYNSYPCYHKAFDLLILDLRHLYLNAPIQNILHRSLKTVKEKGKILYIVSNLEILKNSGRINHLDVISIPLAPSLKPVPEPRFVISRYMGSNEWLLPQMVTDMLQWSVNSGEGIIIFTPDENQMYSLYSYLADNEDFKSYQIGISTDNDKAQLLGLQKREIDILISSDLRDTLQNIENINVVVVNSDDKAFSIDALINICSMAVWHSDQSLGEAVFAANQENENMSLAKSTIRNINKLAWEKGYLSR